MDINGLKKELERVANNPYCDYADESAAEHIRKTEFARRLLDTYFGEDKCEWHKLPSGWHVPKCQDRGEVLTQVKYTPEHLSSDCPYCGREIKEVE